MNTTYADQAKQFEAKHGFPAPPEALMIKLPEWPIPFCAECGDWHQPQDEHSYVEADES